jgi:hypothetical protein
MVLVFGYCRIGDRTALLRSCVLVNTARSDVLIVEVNRTSRALVQMHLMVRVSDPMVTATEGSGLVDSSWAVIYRDEMRICR